MRYCSGCGNPMNEEQRFCAVCGKLAQTEYPQTPQQQDFQPAPTAAAPQKKSKAPIIAAVLATAVVFTAGGIVLTGLLGQRRSEKRRDSNDSRSAMEKFDDKLNQQTTADGDNNRISVDDLIDDSSKPETYDLTGTWEYKSTTGDEQFTFYILENHMAVSEHTDPDTGEIREEKFGIAVDPANNRLIMYDDNHDIISIGDDKIIADRFVMTRTSHDTGAYTLATGDKELLARLIGTWEYSWGDEYYQKATYTFYENGIAEYRGCGKYDDEWYTDTSAYYYSDYELWGLGQVEFISEDVIEVEGETLTRIEPDEDYYTVRDNVNDAYLDDDYIREYIVGEWQVDKGLPSEKDSYIEFTSDGKVTWYFYHDNEGYVKSGWFGDDYEIRDSRIYIHDADNLQPEDSYIRIEKLDDDEFNMVLFDGGESGNQYLCSRR